jgi:4-hydroxy-tetrahydrodipicolinate synthase
MTALAQAGIQGDFRRCRELHQKYLALMDALFIETNPVPVKSAVAAMGLLEPAWRLPLVPPQEATRQRIEATLREVGLLA